MRTQLLSGVSLKEELLVISGSTVTHWEAKAEQVPLHLEVK
jgi:hypothetical protein